MRKYKVVFRPRAAQDLVDLFWNINEQAGPDIAGAYVARIEAACSMLSVFPRRGTQRNDLAQGMRVVGFERRAVIAFRVEGSQVRIIRVFYGGQDYERILRRDS